MAGGPRAPAEAGWQLRGPRAPTEAMLHLLGLAVATGKGDQFVMRGDVSGGRQQGWRGEGGSKGNETGAAANHKVIWLPQTDMLGMWRSNTGYVLDKSNPCTVQNVHCTGTAVHRPTGSCVA